MSAKQILHQASHIFSPTSCFILKILTAFEDSKLCGLLFLFLIFFIQAGVDAKFVLTHTSVILLHFERV